MARIKATRFRGQPINRPMPGIGSKKQTHAIAKQAQAARPAVLGFTSDVIAFISIPI
jgi:hypothetical protein